MLLFSSETIIVDNEVWLMKQISPFRELLFWCDINLVLLTIDLHYVSQISSFAINLHLLFQKGFLLVIKQHDHTREDGPRYYTREGNPSCDLALDFQLTYLNTFHDKQFRTIMQTQCVMSKLTKFAESRIPSSAGLVQSTVYLKQAPFLLLFTTFCLA